VGVNAFERPVDDVAPDLLKIGAAVERGQAAAVQSLRDQRDAAAVEQALGALAAACRGEANVMPPLIAAVRACATEGEIVEAMVEVFGRYTERAAF
jgi:methylmalonyl-CoA mutase N-terminal domain/subunit